jgi:hypothetical protein
MKRFEYLVVHQQDDRVISANGHWQGEIARDEPGGLESCPDLVGYLEQAGAQGWNLVAIDSEAVGTAVLYFKRERG